MPAEPAKVDIALLWIASGLIRVHFDATRSDHVLVPEYLRHHEDLIFEFGLDMPRPIPDLKIDRDGISGTLSFPTGLVQWIIIHWEAVFAISSPCLNKVSVWWSDASPDVQRRMLEVAGDNANEKLRAKPPRLGLVKPKSKGRAKLRSIPGGKK